jgi:hypothetical protein
VECLTIYSYSSYGCVSWHGAVDIESVDVAAAAAAGQDNVEIRYENWKIVFADYVTVGGSEDSDYCCEMVVMFLVCSDCYCCLYSIAHEPATVLAP